ncbi:MAG: hypothetical protein AB7K68_17440 [Bacteriovoracia bacterium]
MPTKILIVQTGAFKVPANSWAGAEVIELNQIKDSLAKNTASPILLVGGLELRNDIQFCALLDESPQPFGFLQFCRGEDLTRFASQITFLQSDSRSIGIKGVLSSGSTIYTESFFSAAGTGIKVDACQELAAKRLKPEAALNAWAAIQSMIFFGLRSLPNQGSGGTGEKVDMQIGTDTSKLACSIQFPIPREKLSDFRKHPMLETLRASAAFFELRFHKEGSRLEILVVFFSGENPDWPMECNSFTPVTPLEDAATVKDYSFRLLGSLGAAKDAKPAAASPFKKKFSDRMKDSVPPPAAAPETAAPATAPAGPPPEFAAKLEALETKIREKDQMITKLGKELAEAHVASQGAKAPVNGKEAQLIQALKSQVTKLEDELAEALEREQESAGQETLAPGMKDQLLRKIKDLDVKLKAATDERSSKIMGLEKQLEEAKKKAKEMSKRITELTEQLKDAA